MRNQRTLHLAEKLYQKSIWDKVQKAARGDRLQAPIVVELDPTTHCDFACPECVSSHTLNKSKFTTNRLVSLAREFIDIGVKAVILIGGGEPLGHPGIHKAIQILGEHGIAIGLTTNGMALDQHQEILERYAQWIRVSVDAATPGTYSMFRPHRSSRNVFNKVINNMKAMAKRKKGTLGFSFLLISRVDCQGNVTATNYHEVFQAACLALDIGCDYFEVKPMYDLSHYLVPQPELLLNSLKLQLEALRNTRLEHFGVIYPLTLDAILNQRTNIEPKAYNRCLVSELRTVLTPLGAYICPYYRGISGKCYGDPNRMPFTELWMSPKREEIINATVPSSECLFHCIRKDSNLELVGVGKGKRLFEIGDDYDLFI